MADRYGSHTFLGSIKRYPKHMLDVYQVPSAWQPAYL